MIITTVDSFVKAVQALENIEDAYDIFEFDCTEDVQDEIYSLADSDSPEPFRNAMHKLGFENY